MKPVIILGIFSLAAALCLAPARAEPFSWQEPNAQVLETGDLKYAPEPYRYEPGEDIRYIDYENGDDTAPGTKDQPWKHHPWDPQAKANASKSSGPITYVFKGGVIYRGALVGKESGKADQPIQLTRDPSWGSGQAALYGSRVVEGFTKGADHPNILEGQKVYKAKLPFATRCVWMVDQEGKVTRLKLARTPNWSEPDPQDVMSQWWTWENPKWWVNNLQGHDTTVNGKKMHQGIDTQNLTREPDYYENAYVWSEWGIVMGSPYATKVERFDPKTHAIAFQGPWYNNSEVIIRGNRYYLEDKPHYLDEAGEFWFDKKGRGGTLYLRLPGDIDPAEVTIEAGKELNLIDCGDVSHIRISGLTMRFTNVFWDLGARNFVHPDVESACFRMRGVGKGITIDHCLFEHVSMPIRIKVGSDTGTIQEVRITDNEMRYTDHGAVSISDSSRWGKKDPPIGDLESLWFLRNRMYHIGWRALRAQHGHAVSFGRPKRAEIAGNFLHRVAGWGISVTGGKGGGATWEVPFTRILIHHNRVEDPLLKSNDWGGIETWQGGVFYVFNNVSGNPGGLMHWQYNPEKKEGTPRFGHAYYIDGGFKNYHFNNIAWGKNNELGSKYANESAFQEIIGFQNTFFNNTAYKFVQMSRRQSPRAGRNKYMGNVFVDASEWIFRHASPPKDKSANVAHAGAQAERFAYETLAYTNNVVFNVKGHFGLFQGSGKVFEKLENFAQAAREENLLASQVGVVASQAPLRDPESHDFRPAANSQLIDRGVKVFVPWALHGVVGEWNFTQNHSCPKQF